MYASISAYMPATATKKVIPCVKPFRVSRDSEIPICRVKHSEWPSPPSEKGIQAGNQAWDHAGNQWRKQVPDEFAGSSQGIHFGQLSNFPPTPPPLYTTPDKQGWRLQMYNAKLLSSSQNSVYAHILQTCMGLYTLLVSAREKQKERTIQEDRKWRISIIKSAKRNFDNSCE